jgi:hypothetical protein
MSLDVPYERLGLNGKIEYIPLKLAIDDIENDAATKSGISNKTNNSNFAKPSSNGSVESFYDNADDKVYYNNNNNNNNMLHFITICMLTVFCVIVLLYAVYYFIILRDRHNNALNPQLLFV